MCGVQPQPSFGTTVGGVRASNPHLVSRRGSLQRLCIGAWGPSAVEVATTPPAERLGPVLSGRATRVPHQTDNLGIERTTTVTSFRPLSWSSSPDQLERIPRTCLIRRRSQGNGTRASSWLVTGMEPRSFAYAVIPQGEFLIITESAAQDRARFDMMIYRVVASRTSQTRSLA